MELRYFLLALLSIAAFSHCSGHKLKRETDFSYDDQDEDFQRDAAADDDLQNDANEGDEEEDSIVVAVVESRNETFHVQVGQSFKLPCSINPSPTNDRSVVYNWLKDDTSIFFKTQNLVHNKNWSIDKNEDGLVIDNFQPADAGVYKCWIVGSNSSVTHVVRLVSAPKIRELKASNGQIVSEHSDVILTCNVEAVPEATIIWSRESNGENVALKNEGRVTNQVLTIKGIRREESGNYICFADNGVGKPATASIQIKVLSSPTIHAHKAIVNSDLGIEAVLECSTHTEPPSHIRWYKNNQLIEYSDGRFTLNQKNKGQHSSLSVTPTTSEDFGTFTCEAENSLGKHNRSIELVQRPVVDSIDVDGQKLVWKIHSHQPLEQIEIQFHGLAEDIEPLTQTVPLPQEKKHEYEIVYVLDDNALKPGQYKAMVNVRNSNDWSGVTNPVLVEIVNPEVQLIKGASVYHGNNADMSRPTIALLSILLTYLLVRFV